MRDFEAYYAAGSIALHGGNPYSTQIWNAERALAGVNARRYEILPFVGPPVTLTLWSLLARLPFALANGVWRALLLLMTAALALTAFRLARIPLTAASAPAAVVAALGFGPLTSDVALGQIALPAFLFATLAVRRPILGVLAWMQPNVALPLLSQCTRLRASLAFAVGAICVAASGFAFNYFAYVRAHDLAERFSAIQITPAAVAYGFGAAPAVASAIGYFSAAAAAAAWIVMMREIRDGVLRFCASCALLPLAMPFFHEHDLLVLFVPAIVLTLRGSHPIAIAGAFLAATDWLGLAQRPDGTVQTLLLIGALGAILTAFGTHARTAMLVTGGALALIAAASLAASGHPAPVWPDAMGALPQNVHALDVASAWHAQQAATGLFTPNATWAALRLLSLLGAALLYMSTFMKSSNGESAPGSKFLTSLL